MDVLFICLPAGTPFNLAAAIATATRLAGNATLAELRELAEYEWEYLEDIADLDDEQLAGIAGPLRTQTERMLHATLTAVDKSLRSRDVARRPLPPNAPVIDMYLTGGLTAGDDPTLAFEVWAVLLGGLLPDPWAVQIGQAAGLLRPGGDGPAAGILTFHPWT